MKDFTTYASPVVYPIHTPVLSDQGEYLGWGFPWLYWSFGVCKPTISSRPQSSLDRLFDTANVIRDKQHSRLH